MRAKKRRVETFSFFDCEGISRHLEKMAAKGWMIEKMTNFFWIYRAIEPKKLRFSVSYYPKASQFDPDFSEGQKTFHEFCVHTGWELACASAQLQIFYHEGEESTPIETEPVLEIESIHAAAKKGFLPAYLLLLLVSLLNGGLFISSLIREPIRLLSSTLNLFSGFCFLVLLTLCLTELTVYLSWHAKAKKAAAQGIFLHSVSTAKLQKALLSVLIAGAVYWLMDLVFARDSILRWASIVGCLYTFLLIVAANGTRNFLKRKGVSRGVNRTLTLTVYFVLAFLLMGLICFGGFKLSSRGLFSDSPRERTGYPLTLEDLTGEEGQDYRSDSRETESFLLGELELRQYPRPDAQNYAELPGLAYRLVLVKFPPLYALCKGELLKEGEGWRFERQEEKPWGAQEAYRLYQEAYGWESVYLLCYGDFLVKIDFGREPDLSQIETVRRNFSENYRF